MAVRVFHLLTSDISHDSLSDTAQRILGVAENRFAADNPQVGSVVVQV
jgi:hypothetical protein